MRAPHSSCGLRPSGRVAPVRRRSARIPVDGPVKRSHRQPADGVHAPGCVQDPIGPWIRTRRGAAAVHRVRMMPRALGFAACGSMCSWMETPSVRRHQCLIRRSIHRCRLPVRPGLRARDSLQVPPERGMKLGSGASTEWLLTASKPDRDRVSSPPGAGWGCAAEDRARAGPAASGNARSP